MTAFSPDGIYFNSKKSNGGVVDHTTSWLTINPYKGCSLNCAYCFRVEWFPSGIPQQIISVEEAVNVLLKHPDFKAHETPISINISSTDALLPKVRETTFSAMKLLDDLQLRNPFGITTKLGFKKKDIVFLSSLKHLRPIIFISLAFIPESVEPVPIAPRVRNLQMLSAAGLPCVLYFRPIVMGWNDSDETIQKALMLANRYTNAICIGSLRQSEKINENIFKTGEATATEFLEFETKLISKELEERILYIYREMNLKVPLFKHTSCAVSHILGLPNYNALYTNAEKNCIQTCPLSQQQLCLSNLSHG